MRSTADTLHQLMDIDRVICVHSDQTVCAPPGIKAPRVYDDGQPRLSNNQWVLLTGFTAKHNYQGPVMHPSEYVTGSLAEHILTHPGLYVAVAVREVSDPATTLGWAVAHKPGA
ncbi:hypothetical protein [Nocardia carnea]|uniref:hypothetical protein n=1 Tax=Nocardia carnea TaxID=37328 RepID=UPI0024540E70|nr:hypothetical protein [Nocardia carnea]